MNNKYCPDCNEVLELRAISSFDNDGTKQGCIWHCQYCGWHSINKIILVTDSNKHLVKPSISFFEIQLFKKNMRKKKGG